MQKLIGAGLILFSVFFPALAEYLGWLGNKGLGYFITGCAITIASAVAGVVMLCFDE